MKTRVARKRRGRLLKLCNELRDHVRNLPAARRAEFLMTLRQAAAHAEFSKSGKLIARRYVDPNRILDALPKAAEDSANVRIAGRPVDAARQAIAYTAGLAWIEIHRAPPKARNREFQSLIRMSLRAARLRAPVDIRPLAKLAIKAVKYKADELQARSRVRTVRLLDRGQKRAA